MKTYLLIGAFFAAYWWRQRSTSDAGKTMNTATTVVQDVLLWPAGAFVMLTGGV